MHIYLLVMSDGPPSMTSSGVWSDMQEVLPQLEYSAFILSAYLSLLEEEVLKTVTSVWHGLV
jgi:hypothetical protein